MSGMEYARQGHSRVMRLSRGKRYVGEGEGVHVVVKNFDMTRAAKTTGHD